MTTTAGRIRHNQSLSAQLDQLLLSIVDWPITKRLNRFLLWLKIRRLERQALQHLVNLDERLLRDIGLTQEDLYSLGAKPTIRYSSIIPGLNARPGAYT